MNAQTNPSWYPAADHRQLVFDFILWFSRLEYAMKNVHGFYRVSNGYIQPKWSAIIDLLKDRDIPPLLIDTLLYMRTEPPNIQVNINEWKPVKDSSDWKHLINSLKTIRNNLFHGGKHQPAPLLSQQRDVILLTHCKLIMEELIKVVPDEIQLYFEVA